MASGHRRFAGPANAQTVRITEVTSRICRFDLFSGGRPTERSDGSTRINAWCISSCGLDRHRLAGGRFLLEPANGVVSGFTPTSASRTVRRLSRVSYGILLDGWLIRGPRQWQSSGRSLSSAPICSDLRDLNARSRSPRRPARQRGAVPVAWPRPVDTVSNSPVSGCRRWTIKG